MENLIHYVHIRVIYIVICVGESMVILKWFDMYIYCIKVYTDSIFTGVVPTLV